MEKTDNKYIKRTQKDYSMSFKLSVVQEYETSKVSLAFLQRKYGIQGSYTVKQIPSFYGKEQRSRAA